MSIEILPLAEADIPGAVDCLQRAFADDPYFRWAFDDPSKVRAETSPKRHAHVSSDSEIPSPTEGPMNANAAWKNKHRETKPQPPQFNVQRNAASLGAHFKFGLSCGYPIYIAKVSRAAPEYKTDREIKLAPGSIVGICWWSTPEEQPAQETWGHWAQGWLLSFRQLMYNIRFAGRGGLNVRRYWVWKEQQKLAQTDLWVDPRGYYFCNMLGVSSQVRGMGVGKRLMDIVMQKADEEGISCYLESSKGFPNIAIYQKMGFELFQEIKCADGEDVCKVRCSLYRTSFGD